MLRIFKRTVPIVAWGVAIMCGANPVWAQDPLKPLALRGYRLGLSLAEFRRLPYVDAFEIDAKPHCMGDPFVEQQKLANLIGAGLSQEEEKAGVKICRYFYRKHADDGTETWEEAGIAIGDIGRRPTVFYFTPKTDDPQFSERLFRIILTFNYTQAESLIEAYVDELGPPQEVSVSTSESETAAVYESSQSIWSTRSSELKILTVFAQQVGSVTYTETSLQFRLTAFEPGRLEATDSEP